MVAKYNATGKIRGIYDHDKIDGSIISTPLNESLCQPPTNDANSLKTNKNHLIGVALLSGTLLL